MVDRSNLAVLRARLYQRICSCAPYVLHANMGAYDDLPRKLLTGGAHIRVLNGLLHRQHGVPRGAHIGALIEQELADELRR